MANEKTIPIYEKALEDFDKLREDIIKKTDSLPLLAIPPFIMPNWKDSENYVNVNLGLRRVWIINNRNNPKVISIKKRTLVVGVSIDKHGKIEIACKHPLDLSNEISFSSTDVDDHENLQCFIIFSQLLNPIMKKVIADLERQYKNKELEIADYTLLIDPVKRTFSALVPFIVAEELDK